MLVPVLALLTTPLLAHPLASLARPARPAASLKLNVENIKQAGSLREAGRGRRGFGIGQRQIHASAFAPSRRFPSLFTSRQGEIPLKIKSMRAGLWHVAAAKTMMILVPPHPLVKHYLGVARLDMAPSLMTKNASSDSASCHVQLAELGRILMYELIRDWLPTVTQEIAATYGPAEGVFIDNTKPIKIIPIGRTAPVLLEQTSTLLPASQTYHVGLKDSAEYYLDTMPEKFSNDDKVLVVIPELASHEVIDRVLSDILEKGAQQENMRIMTVLAAPSALAKLGLKFASVRMYAAMIDPDVDEEGRILPGLGDLEARTFGSIA
eukprot:jgi/Bigna1/72760/fgenesh1_pg.21_\